VDQMKEEDDGKAKKEDSGEWDDSRPAARPFVLLPRPCAHQPLRNPIESKLWAPRAWPNPVEAVVALLPAGTTSGWRERSGACLCPAATALAFPMAVAHYRGAAVVGCRH